MNLTEIKRCARRELCSVNPIILGIFAGAAVLLGVIFALSGAGRYPYVYFIVPKGAPSFFFLVLFWCLAYAVIGASLAIFLFSNRHPVFTGCRYAAVLFFCVLMLSYAWFSVVCKAGAFFLGVFLCLAVLFCLVLLIGMLWRNACLPFLGVIFYTLWMCYLLFYSFSLLLLNG